MAARMAISLASRSRCPSRWRSCSTRPIRRSTTSSASRRNVSAVFFQLLQLVFILEAAHPKQLNGNGASAEIAEVLHLLEQVPPTQLQVLQGLLHGASNLSAQKRKSATSTYEFDAHLRPRQPPPPPPTPPPP